MNTVESRSLTEMAQRHRPQSDEVQWCIACQVWWPCDAAILLERLTNRDEE